MSELTSSSVILASITGIVGAILGSILTARYNKKREVQAVSKEKLEKLYDEMYKFTGETKTFYSTVLRLHSEVEMKGNLFEYIKNRLQCHLPNSEIRKLSDLYFPRLNRKLSKLDNKILDTNAKLFKLLDNINEAEFKKVNKQINEIWKLLDLIMTKIQTKHQSYS